MKELLLGLVTSGLIFFNGCSSEKDGVVKDGIVGEYECSGMLGNIYLKSDGSYTNYLGDGRWILKDEASIELVPNEEKTTMNIKRNIVTWKYKDNKLYFDDKQVCQKI